MAEHQVLQCICGRSLLKINAMSSWKITKCLFIHSFKSIKQCGEVLSIPQMLRQINYGGWWRDHDGCPSYCCEQKWRICRIVCCQSRGHRSHREWYETWYSGAWGKRVVDCSRWVCGVQNTNTQREGVKFQKMYSWFPRQGFIWSINPSPRFALVHKYSQRIKRLAKL